MMKYLPYYLNWVVHTMKLRLQLTLSKRYIPSEWHQANYAYKADSQLGYRI